MARRSISCVVVVMLCVASLAAQDYENNPDASATGTYMGNQRVYLAFTATAALDGKRVYGFGLDVTAINAISSPLIIRGAIYQDDGSGDPGDLVCYQVDSCVWEDGDDPGIYVCSTGTWAGDALMVDSLYFFAVQNDASDYSHLTVDMDWSGGEYEWYRGGTPAFDADSVMEDWPATAPASTGSQGRDLDFLLWAETVGGDGVATRRRHIVRGLLVP